MADGAQTESTKPRDKPRRSDRSSHVPRRPTVITVSPEEFQTHLAARSRFKSPPVERPTEPSPAETGLDIVNMVQSRLLFVNGKGKLFGKESTVKDLLNAGNGSSVYVEARFAHRHHQTFTLSDLGVFLGVVGGIVTSILLTIQKSKCKN
eukprot:COSAG02_NODE_10853_length_1845_cov_10.757732_1_plen_149_part_10